MRGLTHRRSGPGLISVLSEVDDNTHIHSYGIFKTTYKPKTHIILSGWCKLQKGSHPAGSQSQNYGKLEILLRQKGRFGLHGGAVASQQGFPQISSNSGLPVQRLHAPLPFQSTLASRKSESMQVRWSGTSKLSLGLNVSVFVSLYQHLFSVYLSPKGSWGRLQPPPPTNATPSAG